VIIFLHHFDILKDNQIGAKGKHSNIESSTQSGVGGQHLDIKSGIQTAPESQQPHYRI